MVIAIQYCVVWNYEPRAASLAAEIEQAHPDATVRLVESSGGAFEVSIDGDVVFSKLKLGRHAEPGEVSSLLADRLGTG